MEENNNDDKKVVNQVKETAKEGAKSLGKEALAKAMKWALPLLGKLILILLALGFINYMFYLITSSFTDMFSPDDPDAAETSETQSIVEIDSNGRYKIKADFSEQILTRLEELYVSNTAMGFVEDSDEESEEIPEEELKDMIDKYLEASLATMLPDNGLSGNDVDGKVKIKRTLDEDGYLQYMPYSSFKELCDYNRYAELMGSFTINPEDFKLCIVSEKDSETYWDYDGNIIGSMCQGGGYEVIEIDYQTYIEGYATPFNYFLSMHLIAQDKNFMEDLVDMVMMEDVEEPIVFTYVESESTTTEEVEYEGSKWEWWRNVHVLSDETHYGEWQYIYRETINNDNIRNYLTPEPEYQKKVIRNLSGSWQVTKAETWLVSVSKEIRTTSTSNTTTSDPEAKEWWTGPFSRNYQNISDIEQEYIQYYYYHEVEKTITTTTSGENNVATNETKEMKVDEFAEFISNNYPNVKDNLTTAPSNLFYFLQQSESTQRFEQIMRYVIYLLSGIDYGVTDESQLEDMFNMANNNFNNVRNLTSYLRQFSYSDDSQAATSPDGKYYQMIGDGVGWPTIGNADLQWKSVQTYFDEPGKVLENGQEKEVSNIKEYVNSKLPRGAYATYSNAEVESYGIYISVEKVDAVGNQLQQAAYDTILSYTSGLDLSQQQIYPLIAIKYNFGHLPIRNGKTFKQVYQDGAALYEINSWEHNRYIWDNWWVYLEGGAPGHITARDAAFETYVKGIYDFSEADSGGVFAHERNYYIYYTATQIANISYAPSLPITRDTSDLAHEEEIFTYEERSIGGISGTVTINGFQVQQYTSSNGKTYNWYYQNSGPWAGLTSARGTTISGGGCAMTTSCIIASGYGSTRTPDWGCGIGLFYGHMDSVYIKVCGGWDVTGGHLTDANIRQIQEWLAQGGEVDIHMTGGSGWTTCTHWMPLVDISSDGQSVYCMNPLAGGQNGWVSIQSLSRYVNCYHLISGIN